MKKLISLITLCTACLSLPAALPIFFGSTTDYASNTGPNVVFVFSNQVVATYERGSGKFTLGYTLAVDTLKNISADFLIGGSASKQVVITNDGTAGHQRPVLHLDSGNSGGELADLFFYSRGTKMFALQGQSAKSNVFLLSDATGIGNVWKFHDGFWEVDAIQTNGSTIYLSSPATNSILYTAGLGLVSGATIGSGLAFTAGTLSLAKTIGIIVSNTTDKIIDFSTSTNIYEDTNMSANITLYTSNLTAGADVWVYFRTDGTARSVTISTNGLTSGTRISWGFNCVTNGATSFVVTNRARVNLTCEPVGEVAASFEWQQ